LSKLSGQIVAEVGVEKLPHPNLIERDDGDRKEYPALFGNLTATSFPDLTLHPLAVHAVDR